MEIAAIAANDAASTRGLTQLTDNFDSFLTLLTTQLRNQDPLQPLDTEKFTEQLVQFASVEQSIQTNQHLEALIALQSTAASETALSMVDRVASVNSNAAALSDEPAQWRYRLPDDAASISLKVVDPNGAVIAELQGPALAGVHDIAWDGDTDAGAQAPAGVYRLTIEALDAKGAPLATDLFARGRVDAVAFNGAAPLIEIAGQQFGLDLVSRIDADF